MARRQGHLVQFRDIPSGKDMAPGTWVVPDAINQRRDLVYPRLLAPEQPLACRRIAWPIHPLLAVHRTEITPSSGKGVVLDDPLLEPIPVNMLAGILAIFVERPVGPDMDLLFHQFADIGVPGQEPQHFPCRRFPEHPLGGEQRNRIIGKVETHRHPKYGARAHAGAVDALIAPCPDLAHEVEILLFIMLSGNQATNLQSNPAGC